MLTIISIYFWRFILINKQINNQKMKAFSKALSFKAKNITRSQAERDVSTVDQKGEIEPSRNHNIIITSYM